MSCITRNRIVVPPHERPIERLLTDLNLVDRLSRMAPTAWERLAERAWERLVDRVGPQLTIALHDELCEDRHVAA